MLDVGRWTLRRGDFHGLRWGALILRPIYRRDLVPVHLSRFHAAVAIAGRVRNVGDLLECAAAYGAVETIAGQVGLGVPLPNELEALGGHNGVQPFWNSRR